MPRYVAFLRAINVGGHNVKMEELRRLFATLGYTGVESFIASGNLIFSSPARAAEALERQIEARLHAELGYEVKTFLRTDAEVAEIARHAAFPEPEVSTARAFNVGFLAAPLAAEARAKLAEFANEVDAFHTHGREIYWLCRLKQSESSFSNAVFERSLRLRATFRGMKTVRGLAEKYPAAAARAAAPKRRAAKAGG
jgi:uncharacterized protein (DUF1697 family)